MTTIQQLLEWVYLIDVGGPNCPPWNVIADWFDDHGETRLAEGLRLVAKHNYEPDHFEKSEVLWTEYKDNEGSDDEIRRPTSYDWFSKNSRDDPEYLPREVFVCLKGGVSGPTPPSYREYPSRSAAFFDLANALVSVSGDAR